MPKCISCEKSAYFNIRGNKAQYCSTHKLDIMINVIDKLCSEIGCDKRATHNTPEFTSPLYCITHKLDGMVNLKTKRCAFYHCFNTPIYNLESETKGIFCVEHKIDGMVNVMSNRCIDPDCNKIAQFNLEGETKGIYCSTHKLEGMLDIKHKRCDEMGCTKLPSYKLENDTQPRYCAEHKKEGMVDGKHKKCIFGGCSKMAGYGNAGENILYCTEHKLDGMVDVKHRMCEYEGCKLRPVYNVINNKNGKYCATHKLDGMVDVLNRQCLSEWCSIHVTNTVKYEGYCLFCYINLFPDKPVTRNYKTKEKSVVDFVLGTFPQFIWSADKKVQDGCSRRRPDLLLDLGHQVIIIEVDENQHVKYDCSCENKRLMEISQDLGHRNIVFIRFNPDDYILADKSKVKSCWMCNKNSIMCIPKTKTKEWSERLGSLKGQIEYWTNNQTDKMIEVVELFYNQM